MRKILKILKDKKFLILALVSILLLVVPNGFYSAFDKDEPKYLEAAHEMVKSGDYITPYYNYEYRFDKPILIYWLIVAGYKLFGVNEFGGRFFVSLFGVALVLLLYLWIKKWKDEEFAFWSSLILLSLLDFIVMSSAAMPDIVLTFFIAASLMAFYNGYHENRKRCYLAAFAAAGFATLTKGPVGLALPGLVAVVYLILRRDLIKTFKKIPWFSGFAIFTVIVAPWYAAILKKHGYLFFKDFIIFHNIERFTSKIPGHPTEWWYYFVNYPWMFLPFSVVFIFAVYKFWKDRERIYVDDLLMFATVWFLIICGFFQIAHTKLAHYLLPSFPAFAILTAYYVRNYREKLPYYLTAVLLFFLIIAVPAALVVKKLPLVAAVMVVPIAVSLYFIFRSKEPYKPLLYGFLSTMILFKWVTLPVLEPYRAKPLIGKELRHMKLKNPNLSVYSLAYTSPEIVYYYGEGKIPQIDFRKAAELLKDKNVLIVTRENRLKRLKVPYRVVDVRQELLTKHRLVIITSGEKR
ncbi:glycosyltransferase family 39 protein [Desulfurobacterium sp. TC5-1]|uniref:ArnT family glycosyltransferase n=1 Tax=Desulfurobacterium sp. TC5-1 TaxID=1158318 RepID=UPI0003B7846A|nr:glycosyltransferase family 39 protein [Desulfurobacterium sp. TC5-1]